MLRRTADPGAAAAPRPRLLARVARRTLSLATWLLLLLAVAALGVFAIGPRTGKYRTLTVLSGSMSPTFEPGDAIIVVPVPLDELKVGDVITYRIPVDDRRVVTHRVVKLRRASADSNPEVVTRGDANAEDDAWKAQLQGSNAWVLRGKVPNAGYVAHALRATWLQRASIVALALGALLALVQIWLPGGRPEGEPVESAGEDVGTGVGTAAVPVETERDAA